MDPFETSGPDRDDTGDTLRRVVGIVLVVIGLLGAGSVFFTTMDLLNGRLAVFDELMDATAEERTIEAGRGEEIVLPLAFFRTSAYSIGAVLTAIAGLVACSVLKAGAGLLQPNVQHLLRRLRAAQSAGSGGSR